MKTSLAVAVLLFLGAASTADAQRRNRDDFPRSGACFFEDRDFEGDYFCVRADDELRVVPREMNDRISSVRVFGRVEVQAFRDSRFEGRSTRIAEDIRNLRDIGWDDEISSLRVREGRGNFLGDRNRDDDRWGGSSRSRDRYRGEDPDVIVRRAYRDILDREPDSSGLRLYRSHIIDDGWSEADVRDALRKSPEFRERTTMTLDKARDIVRRAYMNVLKREPDSGASGYIDRVMHDKWSQEDVERELRKSPEYRDRR